MNKDNLVLSKALATVWNEAYKFKTNYIPGFFAPYQNIKDITLSVTAPLYAPFLLAVMTAAATLVAAIAGVLCIATFAVAGISSLCAKRPCFRNPQELADIWGRVSAIAAVLIPCFALTTLLSIPLTLTHICTRMGATALSAIKQGKNPQVKDVGDDYASLFAKQT